MFLDLVNVSMTPKTNFLETPGHSEKFKTNSNPFFSHIGHLNIGNLGPSRRGHRAGVGGGWEGLVGDGVGRKGGWWGGREGCVVGGGREGWVVGGWGGVGGWGVGRKFDPI